MGAALPASLPTPSPPEVSGTRAGAPPADSFLYRLRRRAVTIPALLLGLAATSALLPLLVVLAALVDLARPVGRRTFASVRLVLFLWVFLAAEVVGLALLGLVWLAAPASAARREVLTWPVQRFYSGIQFAAAKALFGLRFEVEGAEHAAEGGPMLVLVRHASIVDALLPAVFIANRHKIRLRYVLKRELLADPCLDVAGHFLPNVFVARGGVDTAREVEAVRALKAGIDATSGVILYPEGTRFSAGKRDALLARLAGEPAALERVRRLRHLLPVRPGGALALLDAAPACDVVIIGHSGLEGFARVADIWTGRLVGKTVRLKLWRERAASVPALPDDRRAWLDALWQRLDDWLDAHA